MDQPPGSDFPFAPPLAAVAWRWGGLFKQTHRAFKKNFMKFSVPVFARKENPVGVYRITFDEKHFYIGSSKHLKTRFQNWVTAIDRGVNKNTRIRELAKVCAKAQFEILEVVVSGDHKERERFYIAKYWGDPMFLNYCQDPNDCRGVKFDNDRKDRMRQHGFHARHSGKPIAVFSMDGVIVKEFQFLADAVRFTSASGSSINKVLSGKYEHAKGFKFKWIGVDGYIDPPEYVKKKPVYKGRKISEEGRLKLSAAQRKRFDNGGKISNKARRVNVYDKEGNLISTQPSIRSVYKLIGIKPDKRIEKILRGKKSKSCHGFTFQFA